MDSNEMEEGVDYTYTVALAGHPRKKVDRNITHIEDVEHARQLAKDATRYFSWGMARVDRQWMGGDGRTSTEFIVTYNTDLGDHVMMGVHHPL